MWSKKETKTTMFKHGVPQMEAEVEHILPTMDIQFKQTVFAVTGLTIHFEIDQIGFQGIESFKDLALLVEKDIDQLFQKQSLQDVPLMKQLKLKGLAEVLRERRGLGIPPDLGITQEDVDAKLEERSNRMWLIHPSIPPSTH
jgi:hypothetical protein